MTAASGVDRSMVTGAWGAAGGSWAVLVHGGAGEIAADRYATQQRGCLEAARAAAEVLRAGGSAVDAAQRAVFVLEDLPTFNAGTGATLNAAGLIELDAALMEGTGLRAGGVCALPPFLHPIAIARAALEDGRHVLYAGEGAARFAQSRGFEPSTSEAMTTPEARAHWQASRQGSRPDPSEGFPGGTSGQSNPPSSGEGSPGSPGTVGAVVRDARGGVAAATSTGGLMNKRAGRVGDSPLLGAGTYADDEGGACSATGAGEAIMRVALAKAAVDAMRAGALPEDAARRAIQRLGARVGGTGGLILVDRDGRLGFARNTATMAWAAAGATLGEASGV
jgi:beta-aspartyl-peptidase (threonine type)